MTNFLTPKPVQRAHARSSPSISLERGEARLRAPSENYGMGRTRFHTNNDTGIDNDGVLKTGYLTGNLGTMGKTSPPPACSPIDAGNRSPSHRSSALPHVSHTLAVRRGIKGTPPTSEIASPVDLQRLRQKRERERARRIRQAGGLPNGVFPFVCLLMAICLIVILYVWVKVRGSPTSR